MHEQWISSVPFQLFQEAPDQHVHFSFLFFVLCESIATVIGCISPGGVLWETAAKETKAPTSTSFCGTCAACDS